jgi:tRNA (cytidine/uridine-2'-O-)-methyltransferase
MEIPVDLALYQPDIPQNTGAMLRLGACLGTRLHIIHPTGFHFSKRALRRGGLDYLDHVDLMEHDDFQRFEDWRRATARRLVLLTTSGSASAYDTTYADSDILMVGRESAGVSDAVAAVADLRVRVPMRRGIRSLNVATAACFVLGEALRQTGGFATLS